MKFFVYALGALQIIAGVFFAAAALSAVHQILAAITIGLGAVCVGIGAILDRMDRHAPPVLKTPSMPAHMTAVDDAKSGGWKKQ